MSPRRDLTVCDQVLNLLPAYGAGKLPPDDRDSVRDHLGGCASCREELSASVELEPAMRASLVPPEPPEGFAREVDQRLPEQNLETSEEREPEAS